MKEDTTDKILIIDDNPKNIQLAANILHKCGYNLSYSLSGKDALDRVASIDFSLFLVDVMMPEMDGFELCNRLKANPKTKDIPIVFLTGKTDMDSIVKGFEIGGVDYILKPFNSAELLARVKTHIKLKKAQEEINKKNDELLKLNEAKDRILSVIGHDLSGPVGNLKSILEFISELNSPEQKNEFISRAKRIAGSAYNLLENLLYWSQSQKNGISYNPLKFNLYHVVGDWFGFFQSQSSVGNIKLICDMDKDLKIFADKELFACILRNLISNSLKFTPKNGTITVSAKMIDKYCEITVADTGQGMDEETKSKLFASHTNISTYGLRNEKGFGLGLIICKEFVEKHGGTIRIESEIDKGSKFIISIPCE